MKKIITLLYCIVLVVNLLPIYNGKAASKNDIGQASLELSVNQGVITISVDKIKNAEGFRIYIKEPGATKYKTLKTMSLGDANKKTYTYKALRTGDYSFRVRGYAKGNWGAYSKEYGVFIEDIRKSLDYNKVKSGDIITIGKLEQDGDLSNGEEDIEWIVLEKSNNRIFVMSKYVLDDHYYYSEYENVTWWNCDLNKWLNKGFYNSVFSYEEKQIIQKTKITTSNNPKYDTDGGQVSSDKIFIPSIEDLTNTKYGFSSEPEYRDPKRQCAPTEYASNSVSTYDKEDGTKSCYWWLRNPGGDNRYAAYVNTNGYIELYGFNVNRGLPSGKAGGVNHLIKVGVRPAMYIKIGENIVDEIDGSKVSTPEQMVDFKSVKVGEIVTFGSYEQDNDKKNGREPIEWIVLAKNKSEVTLLSKYVLDNQPYNDNWNGNTWNACTLRSWLNTTFYDAAFSAAEKKKIKKTSTPYSKYPQYSSEEWVFLLSMNDMYTIFNNDMARRCAPTAYAEARGAKTKKKYKTEDGDRSCLWWLRDPNRDEEHNRFAGLVNYSGNIFEEGKSVFYEHGVRPVINIDLKS